jgi:Ca-activated chloride channel homolog
MGYLAANLKTTTDDPMLLRLITTLSSLALLALLGGASATRAADDAPTVMFLLDGSGSMWGKLANDRRAKFDFAREALSAELPRLRPDVRAGLAAFGHRRRGYCADAEVIVPPQAGNAEQIMTPLAKMNATGKGPLVMGLREAAAAIGVAAPATIVLINDDIDNCGQDVCAAATEIAQSNPGLTVHAIGLGLDKTKLQQMSCLPRITGGKLFDVQDEAGLTTALDHVVKLAHLDTESAAEPAEAAESNETKPAAGAAPGLYLSAGLGPDSATLESPVRWRITKPGPEPELIKDTRAAGLVEKLPAGTYEIEARLGLATARQTVDVEDDAPTPVRVNLNAGVLKLLARPAKGAQALPAPTFTVTAVGGEGPSAAPIWIGRETQPEIVLPAGEYHVTAENGLARQEQNVTVTPATGTTFDATLATGELELSATRGNAAGGELMTDGVTYIIYEDDPDAPLGRREVARSAAAAPVFTLPARTYYVTARSAGAEAREQIAIGAGDVVKRTLPLALAHLSLSASLDGQPTTEGLPIVFSVVRLDGELQEIVRTAALAPELDLSAGHYRLEASVGATNVKAATEVQLKAGESAKVALKLQAGNVTLRRADEDGAGVGDVFWEVKDAARHTVLRTSQPQPTALLAPGQYVVSSETRDRPLQSAIEVKAGENRTIEIGG